MKTRSIALALLVAFAPTSFPTLAFAQPADDATTKAARARFQEGVDSYVKGQYENARASFLQAYALRKHPAVLLNLAQSSLKSGHSYEALKFFQQYIRESPNATPAQKSDAEKGIAEARAKVGRLEISAPSGAEITVDSERAGNAPLSEPVDVEPGTHTVKARYADNSAEVKTVGANPGEKVVVKFGTGAAPAVTPLPAPATPPPPSNVPATPPAAGPPEEPGAPPPTPPPPADAVTPGKKSLLAPPKSMVPVYIGGAMVAVGIADAVIFAIFKADAQSKADAVATSIRTHRDKNGNLDAPSMVCGPPIKAGIFAGACTALQDDNDKVDQDALFANIGVGVAIAGAALGVGWYLFSPKKDDAAAPPAATWKMPRLAPMVGSKVRGFTLTGEF